MAITYTTTITGARVTTEGELVDIVKELDCQIEGQDSGCTFVLTTTVKLPAHDAENFVNFTDLTEAEMVAWVEAQEEALAPIRAHIGYVLEKEVAKDALEQKPLPWAPAPAAPVADAE